jgi:hypothetical protein
MIGDPPYDAEAALGAGTPEIGLLTGGFAREALAGAVFSLLQETFRISCRAWKQGSPPAADALKREGIVLASPES